MRLMLNLLDPPVDSNTAISVDPETVATPVMPSRAVISVQEIVYGADHVSPPVEGKALNSVLVVAGKFAGVE